MSESISEALVAQAQLAETIIESQESSVEVFLEYSSEAGPSELNKLSSIANSIQETKQALVNADGDEELEAALEDFNTSGRENDEALENLFDSLAASLSAKDRETLTDAASQRQGMWQELEAEEGD